MPGASYLFLGLLFLAVVLLVEGAYYHWRDVHAPRTRVNRRMEMLKSGAMAEEVQAALVRGGQTRTQSIASGALEWLETKLSQAGMRITPERMMMMMGMTTLGIAVTFPILLGFADMLGSLSVIVLVLILALGVGVVLPLLFIDRKATQRVKKFEEQFPVALDIFVRGLRAGHPVTGALDLLVEEMPDPLGAEFAMVSAEISYGYDLRGALLNLARRVRTSDLQMFVVCVAIQAETGGNLADILEGLSRVIRERASMVLKVRALASEGKMTGIVLSVLPLATFMFVFSTQPRFFLDAVGDSWFLPGITIIIGLWVVGVTLIRRLVALKV